MSTPKFHDFLESAMNRGLENDPRVLLRDLGAATHATGLLDAFYIEKLMKAQIEFDFWTQVKKWYTEEKSPAKDDFFKSIALQITLERKAAPNPWTGGGSPLHGLFNDGRTWHAEQVANYYACPELTAALAEATK